MAHSGTPPARPIPSYGSSSALCLRPGWLLPACLLLLALPGLAQAARVQVKLSGVEGPLLRNVQAMLGIWQEQGETDLSAERIEALHRRAPRQITEALAPFGHYQVQVEASLTPPADGGATWQADYRIAPGEPVRITAVDYQITGEGADNPAFPAEFPMAVGAVLLHADWEATKSELTAIATRQGFIGARLAQHQVLVDPVANQAFVTVHLETGPRYFLGRVRFEQDLLADRFLQRFVNFTPGTVYDPALLLGLQGRLLGTEYFKRVEILPQLTEADPNRVVPILVRAERNLPNKYRAGVGFATDVGPRLSLDYRRRFIGPYGHKARAELEVSQVTQSLTGEYRVPIRNPIQDYFAVRTALLATDTATRKGTTARLSAVHSTVTKGGWRRNLGLDYRYEDFEVSGTEGDPFNGLVPNISWSKIEADDTLNTRNGYRLRYGIQGTVEGVLAATSWVSGTVNFKWIKSLGEGTRLITRTDLGATWAGSLDDVPASQRFFAGGDQSVRGFAFDALGPTDEYGRVVGGRWLATGSLELERRILGNWSGAVFTDFGNAFDQDASAEWEQSAGLGIRYATPIGPVRLDFAYALTKEPGGVRLHFGLGPDL